MSTYDRLLSTMSSVIDGLPALNLGQFSEENIIVPLQHSLQVEFF